MGYGFDGVLRSRGADLSGILNGVDYEEWDPGRGPAHRAAVLARRRGRGKAECKADLLRTFGLPSEPDLPLVGVMSRLVAPEGLDIVSRRLVRPPAAADPPGGRWAPASRRCRTASARSPSATRTASRVRFVYDDALAHQVEAGADMFLMPSRFEPCGLTQMYACATARCRSCARPAASWTRWSPTTRRTGTGTGFRFDHADGTGLLWAIDQALAVHADPPAWGSLVQAGMSRDFSWTRSAEQYVALYRRAMEQV